MDSRKEILAGVKRVVVKIGTNLLTGDKSPLAPDVIKRLVAEIARLKRRGVEVVLVTSGAIGAGVLELGMKRRPRDLPGLQAAAAVGQAILMNIYHECFRKAGFTSGQILLTRDDLDRRDRHLNARHTLLTLLEKGIIPIINENDSVAVDEIKFGDNDFLAALVANLIRADLLIILTDVEGLLGRSGELISRVERITPQVKSLAGGGGKEFSRGGMKSKVEAAGIVTRAGGLAVIADGRRPGVLPDVVEGKEIGTLFVGTSRPIRDRKCWIAFSCVKKGALVVDAGARRALVERGKSLLASGIRGLEGTFRVGDMVGIKDPDGDEFARGLVNYSSGEIEKIRGRKTSEISAVLGHKYYDEVVHRDNLLIL
jgi:glutamate 5-kinase